jgi:hypothetical protein
MYLEATSLPLGMSGQRRRQIIVKAEVPSRIDWPCLIKNLRLFPQKISPRVFRRVFAATFLLAS